MKNTDLHLQIALTLLPGMGRKRVRNILNHVDDVSEFFSMKKNKLMLIPGIGEVLLRQLNRKKALDEAEKHLPYFEKNKIQSFFYQEKNFPRRLNNCEDAPILLFGKGKLPFNDTRIVSVVGTRNATAYGKQICEELIASFEGKNIVVVSGLAYGIDIYVHDLCLKYDIPTIGVLGHGLDKLYPAVHQDTAIKMVDNGGLLTEFLHGTKPDRENFPMRNRIVAGMCDATIVVESGKKGGSLITAELANDYNRDVFAYPGDVTREFSKGCNFLIQNDKAHLITSSSDFFKLMGWDMDKKPKQQQTQLFLDLSPEEIRLIELLQNKEQMSLDVIALKSEFPVSKVSTLLLQLEFMAVVKQLPGQRYSLVC